MTRLTSSEVWKQIQEEGLLTHMQQRAFAVIDSHGPITGSELNDITGSKNMHKRISELSAVGVIRQAGRKMCSQTKRSVMAWEASGAMPHETLKAVGTDMRKKKIARLQSELEESHKVIKQLRAVIEEKNGIITKLTIDVTELKGKQRGGLLNPSSRQTHMF